MNIEYELLNRKGQKLMMICSKIDKKLMIYLAILLMFYVSVSVNCNTYFVFISLRKWNPLLLLYYYYYYVWNIMFTVNKDVLMHYRTEYE